MVLSADIYIKSLESITHITLNEKSAGYVLTGMRRRGQPCRAAQRTEVS